MIPTLELAKQNVRAARRRPAEIEKLYADSAIGVAMQYAIRDPRTDGIDEYVLYCDKCLCHRLHRGAGTRMRMIKWVPGDGIERKSEARRHHYRCTRCGSERDYGIAEGQ